jgi:hypothetical protein
MGEVIAKNIKIYFKKEKQKDYNISACEPRKYFLRFAKNVKACVCDDEQVEKV